MTVAAVGAMLIVTSPVLAANQSVTATPSSQFSPQTVTVTQGDSVTWTNAGGLHNVAFDDGSFTQPSPFSGAAWTVMRTFNTVGSFQYYCELHGFRNGIGMSGTVVVNQASQSALGGTTSPGPGSGVGTQGQTQAVGQTCSSQRRFRIRIRQPGGVKIASARVSVNGKSTAVSKRAIDGKLRHTAEVDLRGLPRGTYKVDIVAVTDKGKELRGTRSYRTCSEKLTTSSLPRL
jgi:plastocyanin